MRIFGFSLFTLILFLGFFHHRNEVSRRTKSRSTSQPDLNVNNSTKTFAVLILAFIFYATLKGTLRTYLQILGVA
jgi:hypothetical protein